jgi:hypothetical protein
MILGHIPDKELNGYMIYPIMILGGKNWFDIHSFDIHSLLMHELGESPSIVEGILWGLPVFERHDSLHIYYRWVYL